MSISRMPLMMYSTLTAGVTVAISSSSISRAFEPAGSLIAQALKLAAVLAFGALVSWNHIVDTTPAEWAFAAAALFIARPAALAPSLALSSLTWRERAAVAWFGPKGFASVFFGIMILGSGIPDSGRLFRLIAIVVAGSIVAHSSTDVLVSKWLQTDDRARPAQ